jgi:DNA-directed RNA polymerase specialized sigma24 family protein
MSEPSRNTVARNLRVAVAAVCRTATDGELLRRFVERRTEAAFAAQVDRHGPMVLRVCRRVLCHRQDAEDAFQATFLVLAHKAASIRKGESLASWLHGVAHRIALRACAGQPREPGRSAGLDAAWSGVAPR